LVVPNSTEGNGDVIERDYMFVFLNRGTYVCLAFYPNPQYAQRIMDVYFPFAPFDS